MVGASVDPVDDSISIASQLFVETAIDQLANHGRSWIRVDTVAGRSSVDAALGHSLVHPLDNIAATTQRPQLLFGIPR